ncbi:MAG: ATP-binding protein [bacterium]
MDYIPRMIESALRAKLFAGKAVLVYGPRQSGKTTLLRHVFASCEADALWLNGDSPDVRETLEKVTVTTWRAILGKKRLVVIDEAQRVPGIGLALKLLVDECPEVQAVATGSSAFELADRTGESLTGRKYEFRLLPFSFAELCAHHGLMEERRALEQRLLYGAYPEIIGKPGDEQTLLSLLAGSYLYKDLFMLENIKKPALLEKLVRALALQLGSEVSSAELSRLVGADLKTVEKYMDLLEKAYVIFSLPAFSRNARAEIRKGRKIYFYDLGIRNAVLGNFVPIQSRTDVGGLWENYLIVERLKLHCNNAFPARRHFWRTAEQSEVDYLEETAETLNAWEFKWNPKTAGRIPLAFTRAYPSAGTGIITPSNYDGFLLLQAPDRGAGTDVRATF